MEEATQTTAQTEPVATIEAAQDIEASTTERGNRFDDEIFMERDPYFIDIASMNGKELAARAGRGAKLLKEELQNDEAEAELEEGDFNFWLGKEKNW